MVLLSHVRLLRSTEVHGHKAHIRIFFPADETADVGIDNQTPVAESIGVGAETRFNGKIDEITLEVK